MRWNSSASMVMLVPARHTVLRRRLAELIKPVPASIVVSYFSWRESPRGMGVQKWYLWLGTESAYPSRQSSCALYSCSQKENESDGESSRHQAKCVAVSRDERRTFADSAVESVRSCERSSARRPDWAAHGRNHSSTARQSAASGCRAVRRRMASSDRGDRRVSKVSSLARRLRRTPCGRRGTCFPAHGTAPRTRGIR